MNKLNSNLKTITYLAALLVTIHIANLFFLNQIGNFGIQPRNPITLPFIFSMPFIHGSWAHLGSNLAALSVLSFLVLLRSPRYFFMNSIFIILISGILLWLFGRPGMHIGASGWLFGLWSLLISRAFLDRRLSNVIIATLVLFFYGTMVFGLLPNESHISFEAHIFGALAGMLCAYLRVGAKLRN